MEERTYINPSARGGLAIGDTGGIPGGPTGLGLSKIPAHCFLQPAHPLRSPGEFTDSLLLRTRVVCSKNITVLLALTEIYSPPRDLYSHSWCLFFENNSEVSSEMCSYGLRKFNVRKDLHLINERLKMGSYTAKVFSAVRIEDEDS